MTREEIDVMWNKAISESMKETQYEFANLILEKAALIAEENGQDEPYGHAKFRCVNIAEAIRSMKK